MKNKNVSGKNARHAAKLSGEAEFANSIFNSITDCIVVIDPADFRIAKANKAFLNAFKLKEEDIIGKTCYEITHHRTAPCEPPADLCPLKETVKTGYPSNQEHIHYDKDGRESYMEISTFPIIDEKGRISQIIHISRDITERKHSENALTRAYDELKEAQAQLIQAEKLSVIGQLASGVAHEIRNPLGIILNGVEYLESALPMMKKDISEIISNIKNGVTRANKIVSLLFDFAAHSKLGIMPESINSVLIDSLSLVKARLKFTNIDIIMEIKKDLPKVLIDRNKMEQVFINLLLNAVQAMPKGGKIFIRGYDKEMREKENGIGEGCEDYFKRGEKSIIIEVEDTGIGIPEEDLKNIFIPFFTTKKDREGLGLGLAVTQNIIMMHKGLIYITSQAGKGTKVTVALHMAD